MNRAADLRAAILARRDLLSDRERRDKSGRIAAALLSSEAVATSAVIFIYASFRSEVETGQLIRALLERGKTVAVSLTRVAEKRLDIVRITDPDRDLRPGYRGIPEPGEEVAAAGRLEPEALDLIVLPGSVFDERGGRYGYGGGYYDRLLARVPAAARVGIAFDLQVVERLELQPHDQFLDRLFTERRIISGPPRSW